MPGKKLLFMGDEFAQVGEWDHEHSLDWHLLGELDHGGVSRWVRHLNELYRSSAALHLDDSGPEDFEWLSCDDAAQSVLVWRRGRGAHELVALANFTPVPREHYGFRAASGDSWLVVANSDDPEFGGSGYLGTREFAAVSDAHGEFVVNAAIPPLAIIVVGRT